MLERRQVLHRVDRRRNEVVERLHLVDERVVDYGCKYVNYFAQLAARLVDSLFRQTSTK